jgi:diguanylate cyclase (GGDEF)-like protein
MSQPASTQHLLSTATPSPLLDPPPSLNPAATDAEPDGRRRIVSPAAFFERLQRMAADKPSTTALMVVDIDDFHSINKARGFDAGDRFLQAVAERLAARLRARDLVSRLGGDEFAVLLCDVPDSASAIAAARDVMAEVHAPVELRCGPCSASVRAGLALCSIQPHDVRALLYAARAALRNAKETGLDVVVTERPESGASPLAPPHWPAPAAGQYAPTGRELRDGLLRGEFDLHYQPIHNLGAGRVDTFEALVRWRHPTRGLLGPASFLPAAERAGLAHVISVRVLDCACDSLRRWRARDPQLRVAVNLSAHDLLRDDFAGTVVSTLERHALPPTSLELELTEHEQLDDERAVDQVRELARHGIALTIDDFGVKYSSLHYLHRLPVRALKVDRSFVHDVGQSTASTSIVAAVVGIAAKMSLRLVAEGVEQASQMTELRRLGCHIMQGFLFSPAVPAEDVSAYLDRAAPAT